MNCTPSCSKPCGLLRVCFNWHRQDLHPGEQDNGSADGVPCTIFRRCNRRVEGTLGVSRCLSAISRCFVGPTSTQETYATNVPDVGIHRTEVWNTHTQPVLRYQYDHPQNIIPSSIVREGNAERVDTARQNAQNTAMDGHGNTGWNSHAQSDSSPYNNPGALTPGTAISSHPHYQFQYQCPELGRQEQAKPERQTATAAAAAMEAENGVMASGTDQLPAQNLGSQAEGEVSLRESMREMKNFVVNAEKSERDIQKWITETDSRNQELRSWCKTLAGKLEAVETEIRDEQERTARLESSISKLQKENRALKDSIAQKADVVESNLELFSIYRQPQRPGRRAFNRGQLEEISHDDEGLMPSESRVKQYEESADHNDTGIVSSRIRCIKRMSDRVDNQIREGGYVSNRIPSEKLQEELVVDMPNTRLKALQDSYVIGRILGSGSFGIVYAARDKVTGRYVVVKTEKPSIVPDPNTSLLFDLSSERMMYRILKSDQSLQLGILEEIRYGEVDGEPYFILDRLGFTLREFFELNRRDIPSAIVFAVGIMVVVQLEYVHSRGIVHRDIKPENLLFGLESSAIHVIDFGLSEYFQNQMTKKHCEDMPSSSNLLGTIAYASHATHSGVPQARRDDLESLGYVMVELLRGEKGLPWPSAFDQDVSIADQWSLVGDLKANTSDEELCRGCPSQILKYFQSIRNLSHTEEPDYEGLCKMLLSVC